MAEQLTLGEIIDALKRANPDAEAWYDFVHFRPTVLDSYRGYYDQLALGYGKESIKVEKLLKLCTEADGATFQGYKGGDFRMSRSTPVWVANYGESGSTAVVGVRDEEWRVVLITKMID